MWHKKKKTIIMNEVKALEIEDVIPIFNVLIIVKKMQKISYKKIHFIPKIRIFRPTNYITSKFIQQHKHCTFLLPLKTVG